MLQVVFQNILMNAAQAMEGQGRIDVTITAHDGRCRVDGRRSRAWHARGGAREGLRRASSRRSIAAPGLGLPIAKRVVEAHGGTIHIDVPPEGGTTISVESAAAPPTR